MSSTLVVAGILIGAAGIAFEIGVSSAILEIIAGAAISGLFDEAVSIEALDFLAHLGMLSLMFMAGFEVDAGRLRETWRSSLAIGTSSLLVPGLGVFVTSYFILGLEIKVAILVAIALSTTSLALVYHALKERGTLQTPIGQSLMASSSVVDVLSMVALAILLGDLGWGTAVFLLAFLPVVFGLPRLGRWFFARYEGSIAEMELRFLLVVLVALGFAAEHVANIHPAVIAFAAGLMLSDLFVQHDQVATKLKGIVFGLLAPIFFLQSGMRIDPGAITLYVIGAAALLAVVATTLKYFATALPAHRLLGSDKRVVGMLFNYRLSFGIIAASVGLKTGMIDDVLYTVVMLVILASAILPVVFLRDRPTEL